MSGLHHGATRLRARWLPPIQADDVETYVRRASLRGARVTAGALALVLLAAWPTDRLVFASAPLVVGALARGRVAVLGVAAVAFLAFRLADRRPRLVYPAIVGLGIVAAALAGHFFGQADHLLGANWIIASALVPLGLLAVPVPLGPRVAGTAGTAAAYVAALWLASPGSPVGGTLSVAVTTVAMGLLAIGLGHVTHRSVRITFERRLADGRRAAELERVVAERTASLRRLGAHLQGSLERERQRIARELHDETSQLLTAMRVELALLRDSDGPDAKLALERVGALLDQTFAAEKRVIRSLRPPELDESGLARAIRVHVSQLGERLPFAVRCTFHPGEPSCAPEVALTAFRAVQECLTNAARHADADHVEVRVTYDGGALVVTITDDGVGFDPNQIGDESFGLLGLRERADALGGTLVVERGSPRGTRILLRLPDRPSSAASGPAQRPT